MSLETEITMLHSKASIEIPSVAIKQCIGVFDRRGPDHKTFVIATNIRKDKKGNWTHDVMAEFDDLKMAFNYPDAKSNGSATLCSSCRSIIEATKVEILKARRDQAQITL